MLGHVRSWVIWTAIAPALAACATTNPRSESVMLVRERAAVTHCVALGQLNARSMWGGYGGASMAHADSMASLKNQAAERGGTHLLLINAGDGVGGAPMTADAYRC